MIGILKSLIITLSTILFCLPQSGKISAQTDSVKQLLIAQSRLEFRLKVIQNEARRCQGGAKPSTKLLASLQSLEASIPRSPETRHLQSEARQTFARYLKSKSSKDAKHLQNLIELCEQRMAKDRVYTDAISKIDTILNPTLTLAETSETRIPDSVNRCSTMPYDKMRAGDILLWDDRSGRQFMRFAVSLYAMNYTHSALYLGDKGIGGLPRQPYVYEAFSPFKGVTASPFDPHWSRSGLHVMMGHVNNVSPQAAEKIMENMLAKYGGDGRTGYHLLPPWDKGYLNAGFYCSQLLWAAYSPLKIDLDSNDWHFMVWFTLHQFWNTNAAETAFVGIFPDEVRASQNITWYYDQKNP